MSMQQPAAAESWLSTLGIHDRAGGLAKARESRQYLIRAGQHVLSSADYTVEILVFQGLLARAQGFHEGAVSAIEGNNPYATFTIIRSYAENAAAILFLKDKPTQLDRFWRKPDDPAVAIGKITNYAEHRLKGFKPIYGQLSSYAHPAARSVVASHNIMDGGRTVKSVSHVVSFW